MSASEAEYQSNLLLKRLHQSSSIVDNEQSDATTDDNILSLLWGKALQTERNLVEELAWHRKLPPEVRKQASVRNLVKLLLRVRKLFEARSYAIKIISCLIQLKNVLRDPTIKTIEAYKFAL